MLNEVFQWTALAGVALLTLAAYRQLGIMIVDSRTYRTHEFGPKIGRRASARLRALFNPKSSAAQWNLLIFVKDHCPTCATLLGNIGETMRSSQSVISLALVVVGSHDYVEELRRDFPAATVRRSEEVLKSGQGPPNAYPFAMLMSQEGVVLEKQIGANSAWLWGLVNAEVADTEARGTILTRDDTE